MRTHKDRNAFIKKIESDIVQSKDTSALTDFAMAARDEEVTTVPFSMEALRERIESKTLNYDSKLLQVESKLDADIFGSDTRPSSNMERERPQQNFDNFPFFDDVKLSKSVTKSAGTNNERKTGFIFDDIISQFASKEKVRSSSANTLNIDQVDKMNEDRLNRLNKLETKKFATNAATIEENDIINSFLRREGNRSRELRSSSSFLK